MDKIAFKWRDIGEMISLSFSEIESLGLKHHSNPEECCRSVLSYWFENPPPDYPLTWEGLMELLEDCQLGHVSELRHALESACFGISMLNVNCLYTKQYDM